MRKAEGAQTLQNPSILSRRGCRRSRFRGGGAGGGGANHRQQRSTAASSSSSTSPPYSSIPDQVLTCLMIARRGPVDRATGRVLPGLIPPQARDGILLPQLPVPVPPSAPLHRHHRTAPLMLMRPHAVASHRVAPLLTFTTATAF